MPKGKHTITSCNSDNSTMTEVIVHINIPHTEFTGNSNRECIWDNGAKANAIELTGIGKQVENKPQNC